MLTTISSILGISGGTLIMFPTAFFESVGVSLNYINQIFLPQSDFVQSFVG
jgi:hypothetical protein